MTHYCGCKHPDQDRRYGPGVRVVTLSAPKNNKRELRRTACGLVCGSIQA